MLSDINKYFILQDEPIKSYLHFLREHILDFNTNITEVWRYGMPFYNYKGKRFCYLWIHKKYKQPYIGIVNGNQIDHPDLIQENRSRMKILLLDPTKDVPMKKVNLILKTAIATV